MNGKYWTISIPFWMVAKWLAMEGERAAFPEAAWSEGGAEHRRHSHERPGRSGRADGRRRAEAREVRIPRARAGQTHLPALETARSRQQRAVARGKGAEGADAAVVGGVETWSRKLATLVRSLTAVGAVAEAGAAAAAADDDGAWKEEEAAVPTYCNANPFRPEGEGAGA